MSLTLIRCFIKLKYSICYFISLLTPNSQFQIIQKLTLQIVVQSKSGTDQPVSISCYLSWCCDIIAMHILLAIREKQQNLYHENIFSTGQDNPFSVFAYLSSNIFCLVQKIIFDFHSYSWELQPQSNLCIETRLMSSFSTIHPSFKFSWR